MAAPSPHDVAPFGDGILTVTVGPLKDKFVVHKEVLAAVTKNGLFYNILANECSDPKTDHANLPDEQSETFLAFMKWLYATHIGINDFTPLPSAFAALFRLYAFAHEYVIIELENAVISLLYTKFLIDSNIWLTLGSDKFAFDTFLEVVSSDTHLYKLVIRSMAYSIRLPPQPHYCDATDWPTRYPPTMESQVDSVMESVPDELWGPIAKEVILMKTPSSPMSFYILVGNVTSFLRQYPASRGW
ncbi:hypothetical protein J7T55_006759 [Diaporthe amygdali]|uniref:uncharacterized protein n=1 Tax=Phomopsis amygdali TaxID=1214568 RepID=UPI0022FE6DB9|nr:uncharacterized protein J7T55_006759 [Diaporthe amygdali]KAJ0125413.1 hypothetical protein J7T55_006759 [Diaporthe amygdali]